MQRYTVYLAIALHVSGGSITHHQKRKHLYLKHLVFVRPLLLPAASGRWQILYAVDTVACVPDDGWRYHSKHVEQFPDIINCVTLHLVHTSYIGIFFRRTDPWTLNSHTQLPQLCTQFSHRIYCILWRNQVCPMFILTILKSQTKEKYGIDPRQRQKIFFFSTDSRPVLGPT
jgi:hypothetical protein